MKICLCSHFIRFLVFLYKQLIPPTEYKWPNMFTATFTIDWQVIKYDHSFFQDVFSLTSVCSTYI